MPMTNKQHMDILIAALARAHQPTEHEKSMEQKRKKEKKRHASDKQKEGRKEGS